MRILLCLLLFAGAALAADGIEPVTVAGPAGDEVYFRITDGDRVIEQFPAEPAPPRLPADTGVLWVDRNHRAGIVQSLALAADGRHALANWYLNAERAACYRILADETPLWESPGEFPWAYGGQQAGASGDGGVLALSSSAAAVRWGRTSPWPEWRFNYPAAGLNGFARCSRDGSVVAAVQGGVLFGLDAASGDTLWTAPVPEPTRLQGLDLSDDGSIVAVTVYDSCLVYEDGARRAGIPVGTSSSGTQYAAAISGDGGLVVTGDYLGRCRLWRWNGSGYDLQWSAQVGNPWIAGVNISRDGSTIACGTGYNDGKLCVFDSSSATPLWVYQGFGSQGAYVASVALSADGSRIAAASWGDRAPSGTFKVLTVHDRADTTPLVGVTRDQEPGSLFAVDISDDGQFVVAGGKAVHAQIMGNGGEVYAVIVGASEPANVGVQSVSVPGRHVRVGTGYTPAATVANYGDSPASFPVQLRIFDGRDSIVYRDSAAVSGLAPGGTAPVGFARWTPGYYSLYRCEFWTELAGDGYPHDDTLVVPTRCYHDAMPLLILPPTDENTVNQPLVPVVRVVNSGSYPDTVGCRLVIEDSLGSPVYTERLVSPVLSPDSSAALAFPTFAPADVGRYRAVAVTGTGDDYLPQNDTLVRPFLSTWEIIYDDGGWNAFYWIGRLDNDKFYVRFTPTLEPPLALTGGRVMVNMANTPFDYVMVCPGSGAKPDTLNPYQVVQNVTAPVAPGWAEFDLDITLRDTGNVWMICHWPTGSPAMGIGADDAPPLDLRSYLSSNQDTFQLWTRHDWMMRLEQSPNVGTAELPGAAPALRLDEPRPNPFRDRVTLSYQVPNPGHYRLALFDAAGRRVALLVDGPVPAGRHQARWDAGRAAPAGLLFARLTRLDTGATLAAKLIRLD